MATLALAPIRVAPAATIERSCVSVRIPPEALTPISGPTVDRIRAMSEVVAPINVTIVGENGETAADYAPAVQPDQDQPMADY